MNAGESTIDIEGESLDQVKRKTGGSLNVIF